MIGSAFGSMDYIQDWLNLYLRNLGNVWGGAQVDRDVQAAKEQQQTPP